jgi:hypothetical protein
MLSAPWLQELRRFPDKDPYWPDPAEGERLTCRVSIKIHEVLPSPIPCDGACG